VLLFPSDLEKAMSDSSSAAIYRSCGSKAMRMKGACRGMQRCDFTSAEVPPLKGVATRGGGGVRGGDDLEEDEEVNSFNLFYTSKAHLVVNYVTSAPYISAPLRT
jgi:hypothetical protein